MGSQRVVTWCEPLSSLKAKVTLQLLAGEVRKYVVLRGEDNVKQNLTIANSLLQKKRFLKLD
jgi:hypothetical protein